MVKHLDHTYEQSEREQGFIPHLFDTIDTLGGYKGLLVLSGAIIAFYLIVVYVVQRGRTRRSAAKRK